MALNMLKIFSMATVGLWTLVFANCAEYLAQSYTDSNSVAVNKPDCKPELSYKEIEKYSQDSRRSISTIKNILANHTKEIEAFFSTRNAVFINSDSAKIILLLHPEGKINGISLKSGLKFDSLSGYQFRELLKKIQFDSIPSYPLSTQVTILVKKNISQSISLSVKDSIQYAPIRSKASIMKVVMHNLRSLKYAYQFRLQRHPGIKGKITIRFAINEQGMTIFSQAIKSTVRDDQLVKDVSTIVKTWQFCPVNIPDDVTEVIYPFVFSQ